MTLEVSDSRSNLNDQIANAAKVIGRSADRRKVFTAIYQGKKRIKTVTELEKLTGLKHGRILQEALKLYSNGIIKKVKSNGKTAYQKYPFYSQHKNKILSLAGNPKKLVGFPTKINPRATRQITISVPTNSVRVKQVTLDDIDSFSKVRKIKSALATTPLQEKTFKEGLQKVLDERGTFNDWGGEKNDLFSTRVRIKGKRVAAAFALKGKGSPRKLTPKNMGKQADQIQRLFRSPAEVFIIQHWGEIDESILEQMRCFAVAKSIYEQKKIFYGIIDGQDTTRLIEAYPSCFS
ncbi:MAG: hypothetical protein ACE5IC_02000 [Candidatus Brocadiales bacterium]